MSVTCTTCGMRKKPLGRSVSAAMANSWCGHDCPGYHQDPQPGTLWPSEEPGYETPTMIAFDKWWATRKDSFDVGSADAWCIFMYGFHAGREHGQKEATMNANSYTSDHDKRT